MENINANVRIKRINEYVKLCFLNRVLQVTVAHQGTRDLEEQRYNFLYEKKNSYLILAH